MELADGGFSGDDDGTSVTASTACIDWYPNLTLYRPLSTPATELGGSAMAHGGVLVNHSARCPVKVRIGFQGPWRTSLRYCYWLW